jgi:hypothetical protein
MIKKPLGCFSVYGLFVALLALVAVGGFSLLRGAALFSPGPLTDVRPGTGPLQGFASHAELERECTLCHRPWGGADAARCLACHTGIDQQIVARAGLHGVLPDAENCAQCHGEHQGREAHITHIAVSDFPHEQLGFSLNGHRRLADGTPFACADCHTAPGYAFDETTCTTCHQKMDAGFTGQHVAEVGSGCLSCHEGDQTLAAFDHRTVFALDGPHAAPSCQDCHLGRSLEELSAGCIACHPEPDLHKGRFGVDCAACHTAEAWLPARLRYHAFPLDHGDGGEVACQICHADGYVTYTCTGCHEHEPAQTARQHQKESLQDIADCARCHPTGREAADD